MPLIEVRGRPHIVCPRCRATIVWPEMLSADEKKSFADECRKKGLEGVNFAKSQLGLDIREAKALFSCNQEAGVMPSVQRAINRRDHSLPEMPIRES